MEGGVGMRDEDQTRELRLPRFETIHEPMVRARVTDRAVEFLVAVFVLCTSAILIAITIWIVRHLIGF